MEGDGSASDRVLPPTVTDEDGRESSDDDESTFEELPTNENENVGEYVLVFDVQRKSLPNFMGESIANPYALTIDQALGRLTINKKGKWNRRFDVKLIEKLELAGENAKLLHIEWKKALVELELSPGSRAPIHRKHSYIFATATDRQQFYEATLFAMLKRGCLNVPTLDISGGKTLYKEKISIFIGTWNMGLAPPPASLEAWIPKDKHDLYFISFQESGWTSGARIPQTQMLSYMWDTQEQEVLFGGLQKLLGPGYVRYAQRSLWQMRYVLFARSEHVPNLSNLQGNMYTTGVGGIVGDKGALGVSFQFNQTSFCFIACHLAPHEPAWATRNAHMQAVAHGLQLGTQEIPCDLTRRFDHIFWSGDINYRIALPRDKVLELIEKEDWAALKKHDQLLNQQARGNCFVGFREGDLNFRPTYRYNRGDRTYSTEKMRTPSWTDRVLWKSLPGQTAKLTAYGCCDEITTSDHSPVYATFEVDTLRFIPTQPIRRELPRKYTIVITELWAKGLIHKFEVKRIEDERKRIDDERKKRIQRMVVEQGKQQQQQQVGAAADGGMLGQVGSWITSFWGKPGAPPASSAGAADPAKAASTDEDEVVVPQPLPEQWKEESERRPEESGATNEADAAQQEEQQKQDDDGEQEEQDETQQEREVEEGEEGLVARDQFAGPAAYLREEEVPITPYICFWSSCLDGLKRTPTVGNTRNPVWRDSEVPRLRPYIHDKEWLSLQYLTLVARDESFWSSSYDDMGQVVIPLREACGDRPVPFALPLIYEGKAQGVVSGKIHVVIDGMQVSSLRLASSSTSSGPLSAPMLDVSPRGGASMSIPVSTQPASTTQADVGSMSPSLRPPFPSPPSSSPAPEVGILSASPGGRQAKSSFHISELVEPPAASGEDPQRSAPPS